MNSTNKFSIDGLNSHEKKTKEVNPQMAIDLT